MLTKVIDQAQIDSFAKQLEQAEQIVIVAHMSPDGDAIGASLGLAHLLEELDKTVNIIVPNDFPDFLKWMPGSSNILIYDIESNDADEVIAEADMICCLDFNTLKRIGDMAPIIEASTAYKVLIDHHLDPEPFCQIMMSYPQASSTSELVFRLICRAGFFNAISRECAECIYTGMMTDTGSFTYNSNSSELYFIISELLSKGIDKDDIYRKVYNTYSESRLRLMAHVLTNMRIYGDCRAAMITLTRDEQNNFRYVRGDSEGFVNVPLSIRNIRLSVFLREDTERDIIKVSLRSVGNFPCNQMATQFFSGGGHRNASGGELKTTMQEAINIFEQAIEAFKPQLTQKLPL
jgi:phosphoesterase RecJ-like protein